MRESLICKNCGNSFSGKFCNNCGEKVYTEKDRSVKHILSDGLHFITHLEGSFFNTVIILFKKPGKFSLDYCNGVRKKYFKPLSFFLLLVILYLLFPIFPGLNSSPSDHVRHSFYGKYAMSKALKLVQERHWSDAEFGVAFHQASEKISKFLLFLIIPVMALFSWAMSFKKRKYFYDNFVFSIEANSFFILWGFLILPVLFRVVHLLFPSIPDYADVFLLFMILGIFLLYLYISSKRFFAFNSWYSIIYSLLFTLFMAMFIQYVYKFILFFITIHVI